MTATVNASEWTKAYNQGWKDGYNSHVSKYRNPYVLTDLRQAYHDGYFYHRHNRNPVTGETPPLSPLSFADWEALAGVWGTPPTTEYEAVSVCIDHNHPHFSLLWQLDDYKVSTVSGPIVWLLPR